MSIIKCPECGSSVSTMAGTCPNCGVKIHGNLRQCTHCGTYYLGNDGCCPYCNHKEKDEENRLEATTADTTTPPTTDGPQPPRKPKRGVLSVIWKSLLSLTGTAIVLFAAYEGYGYYTHYTQQMEEKQRFEELAPLTNPDFYRQYLADYPNSVYRPEVEKRLQTLIDEDNTWKKVLQENTKEALTAFMQNYSMSLNLRKCRQLIDSIDWETAQAQGTEEAIAHYLEEYPEGTYTNEAVELKKKLDQQKTTPQENEAVTGIVYTFFHNTLPAMKLEELRKAVAEPMTNFCGTAKAKAQQVVKFVKDKHTKQVEKLEYAVQTPVAVTRVKLPDGTTGFKAEFTLEEITTPRDKKKKNTTRQYAATCLINGSQKIESVELTDKK